MGPGKLLCRQFASSLLLTHTTQIEFKSLPLNRNSAPGGDPRTATTIFLFEEFVPLEYRQQLAKDSGTKRRLPFLFSPSSKSRPWKPAATLNGRPYVVGHVPKSPTLREVEFEGMLRSNGSKILTLSKAAPTITVSPVTQGDSDHTAHSRPGTAGSGRASPARQLERVPSDSPLTPGSTKRRFRIPVPSPSVVRRSTLVPAEYSTVDFETRLASYSDDELNENASLTPAEKHERRMSRDDAWVDILVAAHSRRMGSQEAERRPGAKALKGGRSDPELASQEIALVLAGVRARSPLSDDEEIQVHQTAVEPVANPTTPQETPKEEQDPDVASVMSYPKTRRVGYFDLHPERRPGGGTPLPVRPQVNANDSDGDDVPDQLVYGTPESSVIPAPDAMRPSFETEGSEYGPSATSSPTREIDVPDFVDHERSREEKESLHCRAESTTLPQFTQPNDDIPKPTSQSKTASLIEMYRERERQSLAPTVPSSKLPIRSASLPPKSADLPPIPPLARTPSPVSVPESDPPEIGDEAEPEPGAEYLSLPDPNLLFSESGRNSPGRYIHGAPLHNVLEEEEEED